MVRFFGYESLWFNRNRKALFLFSGLTGLPNGYGQVVLPIYFSLAGISSVMVGILTTISLLTTSILLVPFGVLSDRYGRKVFLIFGGLLTAISWAVMALTDDFNYIAISRSIAGVGTALTSSPFNAALADVSSDRDRNMAFGVSSFVSQIASMLGALLSGVPEILQKSFGFLMISSYKPLFSLACVTCLASMGLMLPFADRPAKRDISSVRFQSGKRIFVYAVTRGLTGFGAGFVIPLFSLWFHLRFGVGGTVLGPLFAISNATLAFSYLISSKLANVVGSVNSLALCHALATILLVAIPEATEYGAVAVLYVARNFLMNMSQPIETSFLMGLVRPEERASASAVTGMVSNIARAVSPSFGGYFMSNVSLSLPFYVTAVLYGTSTAIFYSTFRKIRVVGEKKKEREYV